MTDLFTHPVDRSTAEVRSKETPRPGGSSNRVALVVIGAVVFTVLAVAIVRWSSSAEKPPNQASIDSLPKPSVDGLAFVEAIARTNAMTFHAVYKGQATNADGTAAEALLELWSTPAGSRRDLTLSKEGQQLVTQEYRSATTNVACFAVAPAPPGMRQCQPIPEPQRKVGTPAFGSIDPAAAPVAAASELVAGVTATCYRVAAPSGPPPEVCFDAEGVPFLIADGEIRVTRTSVDATVPEGALTPPGL